jgi:hypothetical protein
MATDVAKTVNNCAVCAKNRIHERKRASFLKLFPATEPLEFVSLDILGPLPKTEHGNIFLLVITDRFSKLTRTVPLRTISAFVVAKAFSEHLVFVYGPPRYTLTDKGAQFTAKFFIAVCRELGVAKVFTMAYHPQKNGQVERYNRTIINALRGFVCDRQNDWDEFTSSLTFGYNCRIHSSLGRAPFELVFSRPPPPLSVETPEKGTADTPENARVRFLQRLKELHPLAQRRLAEAQARYKAGFDRSVREMNKELPAGSWVYIRREVHETGKNPKLDQQVDDPYRVVETDGRTFVLQHGEEQTRVSLDRVTPAPAPLGEMQVPRRDPTENERAPGGERAPVDAGDPEEEAEYVFEKILGVRQMADGTLRYRVRWYGYGRDSDTWEPANHLPESDIRRYHRRT